MRQQTRVSRFMVSLLLPYLYVSLAVSTMSPAQQMLP